MLRGAFEDFYPYPFIDVTKLGFDRAMLAALALLLAFGVGGAILIGIDRFWPASHARADKTAKPG